MQPSKKKKISSSPAPLGLFFGRPPATALPNRATFKYEDKTITLDKKGTEYDDFLAEFTGLCWGIVLPVVGPAPRHGRLSSVSEPLSAISLSDDKRLYGYVRIETGDELSKRAKFALVTWVGPSVSVLKKAKVSTGS